MIFPFNVNFSKNLSWLIIVSLTLCAATGVKTAQAETDWKSFTFDNDALSLDASDSGYSNGMFYSWYDTDANNKPEPGFFSRAMLWSLSSEEPQRRVSAKTVGQIISTPADITVADPPADGPPYAGLLFYSDSFITIQKNQADKISTTIGVVGPASLAEQTQIFVHKITGSDTPEGWDTQLANELVFQFSRAQTHRAWVSDTGNMDVLLGGDAALGTIQSSVGVSAMFRYGGELQGNFGTSLLANGRTANPVAIDRGWYLFAGTSFQYMLNIIFLDGNTYTDSRSTDYDPEQIAFTAGFAYARKDLSITFAVNDLNIVGQGTGEEFSKYGSLTVAWRY